MSITRGIAILLFIQSCSLAGLMAASAQEVRDTSYKDEAGGRVMQMEIEVPAAVEEVWRLWTTSEGLQSWMAPVIAVDLRIGGDWEASYDPAKKIGDKGNIHNEVLSFLPYRMLSIRVAKVPEEYPLDAEKVKQTHTVVLFDRIDEATTRVQICGVGYGEGDDWDTIYRVSVDSTRYSLRAFYGRCAENDEVAD